LTDKAKEKIQGLSTFGEIMLQIKVVDANEAQAKLDELVELLQDAVADGASVGFLPPLATEEALHYWQDVIEQLGQEQRLLLVALEDEQLAGVVQLELALKANARHRAEVQKLIVHTKFRRRGLGQKMLAAVDEVAQEAGRSLLVLDTRLGDAAEQLYRKYGYIEAGVIPRYAISASGILTDTIFFYRELPPQN
jgi:ribosomal protein S18 acetylase RimI-like enzyme